MYRRRSINHKSKLETKKASTPVTSEVRQRYEEFNKMLRSGIQSLKPQTTTSRAAQSTEIKSKTSEQTKPKLQKSPLRMNGLNSGQVDLIRNTLLLDRISGSLIELTNPTSLVQQLKIRIRELKQALEKLVGDGHEFYFLSRGFHNPFDLFTRINEYAGISNNNKNQLQILSRAIKNYILEFANLEINNKIAEITANSRTIARLQKQWRPFYTATKQSIIESTENPISSTYKFEYEMETIEDLKNDAAALHLSLTVAEEKIMDPFTGLPIQKDSKYLTIQPIGEEKPSLQIKLLAPTEKDDLFKTQEFYDHTVRDYFKLTQKLRAFFYDKIYSMTVFQRQPPEPYLIDIKFPSIVSEEKNVDIIMWSELPAHESLPPHLLSLVESIETERLKGSQFHEGFIKIAKYLDDEIKDADVTHPLKILMTNKYFYPLFESKKIKLTDFSGFNIHSLLLPDEINTNKNEIISNLLHDISILIATGLLTSKNLNEFTRDNINHAKILLAFFPKVITHHKLSFAILNHVTLQDVEFLKQRKNDSTFYDYLLAVIAIRKTKQKITTFHETRDFPIGHLETENEGLLKLIQDKLLTRELIQTLPPDKLSTIVTGANLIKDRSPLMQSLFVHGLLSVNDVNHLPLSTEEIEHTAKLNLASTDTKTIHFNANFLLLFKLGLLDEYDLLNIQKNKSLKSYFERPHPKNIEKPLQRDFGIDKHIQKFCTNSLERRLEFIMAQPKISFNNETISQQEIEGYLSNLIKICETLGINGININYFKIRPTKT